MQEVDESKFSCNYYFSDFLECVCAVDGGGNSLIEMLLMFLRKKML